MTTGDMPLSTEGRLTSVSMGGARVAPTRRFLFGLGEWEVEGGLKVGVKEMDAEEYADRTQR